jgi:hypothetical protein
MYFDENPPPHETQRFFFRRIARFGYSATGSGTAARSAACSPAASLVCLLIIQAVCENLLGDCPIAALNILENALWLW